MSKKTALQFVSDQSDIALVLFVVGILMILITPISPQLLDFLIIANFSFALLILLLTFYVEKPLQFSTFPSLLLIATLFRLSLNIAATRLILGDADAGQVIASIGRHVVGGNYVIGLIVFTVLIVVQYVVVTNGAQRVAEVAARFTLDSMPGKQMSIDADMNIGLIDDKEARRRRLEIEKEASFYGSMDGASKFVKGDAIAGIIIILIDIVGGLTIGIAQRGMPWAEALHTYTLLTVGDGIVTQIPALIISTGTGIIVTRAASDAFLSREISKQITAYPKTLVLIAAGLLGLMAMPGIPAFPVLAVLLVVAAAAFVTLRSKGNTAEEESSATSVEAAKKDVYGMLAMQPLQLAVGMGLVPWVEGADSVLNERIAAFRKQHALDMGFVVPAIRIRDDKRLSHSAYELLVHGIPAANGEIEPGKILAIGSSDQTKLLEGKLTKDPTYGLPAAWISESERTKARDAGFTLVEPHNVILTHVIEVIKRKSTELLTRSETAKLLDTVRAVDSSLVDELIPSVLSLSEVQRVLQSLLKEQVSIRNLQRILEILVDAGRSTKDSRALTEKVRAGLSASICHALTGQDGELRVLTLDPSLERNLIGSIRSVREGDNPEFLIEPRHAEKVLKRLVTLVERMMSDNLRPVILTAPELRPHFQVFASRVVPHLTVLSLAEVPDGVRMSSFGMVSV